MVMSNKLSDSPLFKYPLLRSFLFYSIFRAIYGIFILAVTWFFATNPNSPTYLPALFLIFSIFFSRYIFKKIKNVNNDK